MRREPHPWRLFLAYAGWMVVLLFFLWLNRGGNVLVSVVASLAVLSVVRVRTE